MTDVILLLVILNSTFVNFLADLLARGENDNGDIILYWDSWDRKQINSGSQMPINSVSSQDNSNYIPHNNFQNASQAKSSTSLASPTPPSTPSMKGKRHFFKKNSKFMVVCR